MVAEGFEYVSAWRGGEGREVGQILNSYFSICREPIKIWLE